MGLHIHTLQSADEALLKYSGDLDANSARLIEAAIRHFQSRGCKIIQIERTEDFPKRSWAKELIAEASDLIAIRQE